MLSLNEAEFDVMNLLWIEDRPLLSTEIVSLLPSKSWKNSTVHTHINSLMAKNAIHVEGVEKSGKVYARKFAASISADEYLTTQLTDSPAYMADKNTKLKEIFASLVGDGEISIETLGQLEDLIKSRKKELQKK